MKKYSLATVSLRGEAGQLAVVKENRVATVEALRARVGQNSLAKEMTLLEILEEWNTAESALDELVDRSPDFTDSVWLDEDAVTYLPPVNVPRQVFCTGANYRTHVVHLTVDTKTGPEGMTDEAELRKWAEKMMDDRLASGEPYVFTKPVSAVSGPNDKLVLPKTTVKPDWEIELAVVIGKGGYQISREAAMDHVAGYALANDISARDLIPRTDYAMLGTDWLKAKGQPGFLPLGPWFVPAKFVPDPYCLAMRLSVSDKLMQDESTGDMMFDIARQIEYISRYATLLPGDVICTGSPAGNGTHYNRFLQDGDLMVGEIEGLGTQRILCVAEK